MRECRGRFCAGKIWDKTKLARDTKNIDKTKKQSIFCIQTKNLERGELKMAWSKEKDLEATEINKLLDSKNAIYRILLPVGWAFELKSKILRRGSAPKPPGVPRLPHKTKHKWELVEKAVTEVNKKPYTRILYIGQTGDLKRRLKEHLNSNDCITIFIENEIPVKFQYLERPVPNQSERNALEQFCREFGVCPPCNCKSPECACQKIPTLISGYTICKL